MSQKEVLDQIDQHLKDIQKLVFALGADADKDQKDGIDDLSGAVNEITRGIMPVLRALWTTV